jgi:hypothetical protein
MGYAASRTLAPAELPGNELVQATGTLKHGFHGLRQTQTLHSLFSFAEVAAVPAGSREDFAVNGAQVKFARTN